MHLPWRDASVQTALVGKFKLNYKKPKFIEDDAHWPVTVTFFIQQT